MNIVALPIKIYSKLFGTILNIFILFIIWPLRVNQEFQIGNRTFNDNPDIHSDRPDLFQKMIQVDADEPTDEEREKEAITKFRYLSFRDHRSTTTGLCK